VDDTDGKMIISKVLRKVIGGKLENGEAALVTICCNARPIDTDVELSILVSCSMINLEVFIVISLMEDRDLALSGLVEFLMDEIQDQNYLLHLL
jgi:hypothetical protein